jgi:Hypothetical glycosyl hydrolase 6/Beta-galactosidase trimerisation domain
MSGPDSHPTRREFVARTTLGGVAAWASFPAAGATPLGLSAAAAVPGAEPPEWVDKPMRWAQLVLVENDPGQYDRDFWLDYFRRTHSQAVNLSAGGCVAYYPTKIPLHHRSAWMRDSDPFGELVEGCRKLDMVIVARTDPHAALQDVYDAHPEWIAVDEKGEKRRHWADPERWVTCGLGPYNFEFMTEVHKEILSLYKIEGIFINRWSGSGMCYCESCRKNFHDTSGMDLPRTEDPQDPARRAYILWRQQRLFDLWRLWDAEVRKIYPPARVIPNTGGGALSSLDMDQIGRLADTLFADRQARRGLMMPWAAGKNGKEYRATLGEKPIAGITSVGLEEPYRWKDSVQSGEEIRVWMADGVANGLRPWFTKFSGTLYDERWLKPVEEFYQWHHSAERYLRNTEPLTRVAMVYSQQTAWFYGGPRAGRMVEDHTLGFYHALIEARIPFEMVHDRRLDAPSLDRFKTLILPNIAALSEQQCQQLRDYVGRGGSLVATFETSLYDEWGVRRKDFGLADVFGATFQGNVEHRMQNSYLKLHRGGDGQFHPLLGGLEDAGRIVNGVQRVEAAARGDYPNPPLTLIPSYPDLPMEAVYPRVLDSGVPGVFVRDIGSSRVVYFPWDIDRTFWEVMAVDHGKLLRNSVEWAMNEDPPVTVTGAGVLDVTAWRQKDSMTVHLVNLTNPMMMKGPYRELIPAPEQKVRVKLPGGSKAKKVQLLVSGQTPQVQEQAGVVELTLPSILLHEVIAIDL